MGMQSEFEDAFLTLLYNEPYTADAGTTLNVGYYDNTLDSTVVSNLTVTKSKTGNHIYYSFELGLGTGNTNTINAVLLKMDDNAVNKAKHTDVVKNLTRKIQYKIRLAFVPLTN